MRWVKLSAFRWARRSCFGALLLLAACESSSPPLAAPAASVAAATAPAQAAASAPAARPAPASVSSAGAPHNAFVLLSGGGTPLSNHYSQYLQAHALAAFFEHRYSAEATWVFFGIGNRDGETPILADVHQQLEHDHLVVDSWRAGPLHRNRPATRESFLTALRDEILPIVHDGGTLFLFVGDHGELSSDDQPESEITLWQLKSSGPAGKNWSTDNHEVLSVTDLRNALAKGLGRGRVVFCMTQCHSGGFQFLGVPREIAAPAGWFTVPPAALAPAPLLLPVAGFTATDEASLAAGCDPDPNPEKWAGYERYLPERLLGVDLFTLNPTGAGVNSFAEAHEAAVLVDGTIDQPRSSSEQFLETWARTIERLAASPRGLSEKSAAAVRTFQQAVNTGRVTTTNADVRAKAAEFERFTRRLTEQNPSTKELLLAGTRRQLEQAAYPTSRRTGSRGGGRPRGATDATRQAWRNIVRPAWKAAVLADKADELPARARDFEIDLLRLEDRGRDYFLSQRGGAMLNEIFWNSGYAYPATLDHAKAEAVARWGVERSSLILAWAKRSPDEKVSAAADVLGARRTGATAPAAPGSAREDDRATRSLSPQTAAERVLFYRRTLAAWECLVAMDERAALAQLAALIELERTPLPPPSA